MDFLGITAQKGYYFSPHSKGGKHRIYEVFWICSGWQAGLPFIMCCFDRPCSGAMKAAFTFTRKRKMYRGVTVMREALNLSAQLEPPPQDCCMAPIPPLPWYVGYGIILLPSQTNNAHIGGYVFPRGKRISRFVPVCVCRVWLGGKGAMRFSRAYGSAMRPFIFYGGSMEQPFLGPMGLKNYTPCDGRENHGAF